MSRPILDQLRLGVPWPTLDPFLFCVHHKDAYPRGNGRMAPAVSLAGRALGQDFSGKDGFSMYHGQSVPGFPSHPHRGFETVTIGRAGLIDHSDSLGATARFGRGDVQWLTAGSGIVHAEMFPLVEEQRDNPLELFQIWLNLPSRSKFVPPYFTMFWRSRVPAHSFRDSQGRVATVTTVAGSLGSETMPAPPPDSWASSPDNDVAIWSLALEPGASWLLPAAAVGVNRVLYFFAGDEISIASERFEEHQGFHLRPDASVELLAGASGAELLLLQGRPISEPVVNYGPFVMNSPAEIRQAIADYQKTQFGGWPYSEAGPVHGTEPRFARHADGRVERATE